MDDEPEVVQFLEESLVGAGYQVVTALDGREALQKVAAERPDLVVLDDLMPSMDGLEVLRRLHADLVTADIPVIMVAARAQDSDVFRGYQAGVDAYLTKPINPGELLTCVQHVIDSQAGVEGNGLQIKGDPYGPLIRLSHTLLQQALDAGASEIQVEPQANRIDVRFRTDDAVREVVKLPRHLHRKLVARYKLMADMDVEEQSVPQDGRIAVSHQGRDYDIRVHSQPTPNGEKVILTIHAR